MASTYTEMQQLMQLFNCKRDGTSKDSDSDDNDVETPANVQDVAPNENEPKKINPYAKLEPDVERQIRQEDYENNDEFLHDETVPSSDWKKTPKWQLSYRQQVTPTDVFLQIGSKNPSTACCEDIIIDVYLPNEKRQNIDLKIMKTHMKLISPNFLLDIPLPQPVDPQLGNAQWDKDNEKLVITLKMEREFDYVNF